LRDLIDLASYVEQLYSRPILSTGVQCLSGSSATRSTNVAGANPAYVNGRLRQRDSSNSTGSPDTSTSVNEDNEFVTSAGLGLNILPTSEVEPSTAAALTTVVTTGADYDDDVSRPASTHSTTADKHQVIC